MKLAMSLTVTVLALAAASSAAFAQSTDKPVTLKVTGRVELGPAFVQGHYVDRWGGPVVTREGWLLFFYATPSRKVQYVLTRDGKTFEPPVTVASGIGPSATMDAAGNIYLAYKNPRGRAGFKKLTRTGPGKWDASAAEAAPFARFGGRAEQFPSILILPGSDRIWYLYNFVPRDLREIAAKCKIQHKLRSDPVLTYSDDGGKTWAEPVYIGSDSGDIGTGVVVMRPYRGRPAWFWAYWDCAPPAWGFYDGSRFRPLREFFAHLNRRTAAAHPWDMLEAPDGKMYFATGLDHRLRGQIYRYFDGAKWSDEVLLNSHFGKMVLANDGKRTFLMVSEGARPRGKRILVYELDGTKAVRKPEPMYTTPAGRLIHRFYVQPANRQTKGYFPVFVIEETPKDTGQLVRGRKRFTFVDPKLVYLRAEVVPADPKAAAAEAAKPLLDEAKLPKGQEKFFKPLPIGDDRIEPRTDVSKDRKIVRVGERWVIVYAEDNPGRLMAGLIENGKLVKPIALIDKPGWNRYQCAAVAHGDDALVVVSPGPEAISFARLDGVKNWPKSAPKVSTHRVSISGGARWPTVCRTAGDRLKAMFVAGGKLAEAASHDGRSWTVVKDAGWNRAKSAPPTLVSLVISDQRLPMLLEGRRDGIWHTPLFNYAGGLHPQAVKVEWIGHHYSASAGEGRIDVIYTPRASHLGKKLLGHVRFELDKSPMLGQWKPMPPVDEGVFIQGLSLCSLGGGKLLCVYSERIERPEKPAKGVERLRRFHYAIKRRTFDGAKWSAAVDVPWPKVNDEYPKEWKGLNRAKGLAWVPAVKRGMFPTLPANAKASEPIPVAWMVPGFDAVVRTWPRYPQARGGLLVTTEIKLLE